MAQPTDLTGMLTAGLFEPTQKPIPSSYRESILGAAQQAGTGLRRGIGAMTGADTRTNPEMARKAMEGLDINNPAHQPKILQIVRKYAPEREAAMVAQFAQQGRQRSLLDVSATSSKETRASVAKQLEQTHPSLANAIIKEQASGKDNALQAGLKIISEKTTKVQDPALVKEYKYAVTPAGGSFEGDLEDWALLKKTKGPTFNLGDKAEAERLSAKLGIQAEMYEGTRTEQEGARQKITTGQSIIKAVDDNVFTGAFAETLTDFSQGLENIYTISGIAPPVKLQQTVLNAGTIKKAGFDAMLPLIEAQGRGFTDKDREHAKTVLPGLSQSWQYNELAGTLSILEGNTSIEKNKFARKRAMLDDVTDAGGQTLWTQYLEDVPMSKTVDAERNGLKYKKVQPLKDNEDLSQYWVSARPTGFKINMQGEVVSKSMGDIAEAASEYGYGSIREFLADLSRQGLLIDGVY
jgi:hypothetical protein